MNQANFRLAVASFSATEMVLAAHTTSINLLITAPLNSSLTLLKCHNIVGGKMNVENLNAWRFRKEAKYEICAGDIKKEQQPKKDRRLPSAI